MNEPAIFHFHSKNISGKVDRGAGVIRGVAVITGNVTARGHNLEVDDKTIEQIIECGQEKGKVQVKLNHKSGVQDICGYLSNFRAEGNKGLADWFLLKTHEEYEKIIEKAERMPDCFGLSASFAGPKEGEKIKGGKNAARCTELLAVDCVPLPAANPDGLFEAKLPEEVDISGDVSMADKSTSQEPTNAQILEALTGLNTRLDGIESRQQEIADSMASNEPFSPEELAELQGYTDEQLAEAGLTRAQIDAAVKAVNDAPAGDAAPGDAAAAAAGKTGDAATAATAVALSSLRKQVVELSARIDGNSEDDQINHAFEVLEDKVGVLTTELAAKDQQIVALQRVVRMHGAKAASPSTETTRMFSAKEGDGSHEFEALVTDTLETGKAKTRATAIQFAIKENPRAYAKWRQAKGISKLADEASE